MKGIIFEGNKRASTKKYINVESGGKKGALYLEGEWKEGSLEGPRVFLY